MYHIMCSSRLANLIFIILCNHMHESYNAYLQTVNYYSQSGFSHVWGSAYIVFLYSGDLIANLYVTALC